MAPRPSQVFAPHEEHRQTYDVLYGEYKRLYDHFGRGGNDVMKLLRGMRRGS
jgi:L-ribulokinase